MSVPRSGGFGFDSGPIYGRKNTKVDNVVLALYGKPKAKNSILGRIGVTCVEYSRIGKRIKKRSRGVQYIFLTLHNLL